MKDENKYYLISYWSDEYNKILTTKEIVYLWDEDGEFSEGEIALILNNQIEGAIINFWEIPKELF